MKIFARGTMLLSAFCLSLLILSIVHAETGKETDTMSDQSAMILLVPNEISWSDVPPALPPGAKIAVLEGNPFEPGPYSLRLKMPANYKIPAHWHTMIERVTVISGTMNAGMGDKLDPEKGKAFPAGSFIFIPAKMNHFAWAGEDTIVQINGDGPFDIHYINPADDPRNTASN